ncbi:Phage regulatory protein Rha [Prevotella sp. khp1]|uniref:Rha family transcriptional regulator n=1 Tax=Prevotellaceae TaxID=171552 RepID=UPI0008871FCF|nr:MULTISPECIES: Rha family transcriptional regulator [Prevotellaceae]QVJ80908.1 phage regulatory protein/antirepressor Ant [Xylanibacter ruminicola]SDQ11378.1 Phage regulatory protein Rha [Prevotella sp. khp1]
MITTTVISTTSLSTRKTSLLEQQSPHMTSLEVAEICGKRHADLMRAIRNMEPAWQKIRGCKFALSSRKVIQNNGGVRDQPCYELTKTETLYIATKFKDEERAKLVLRWEQLEMERLIQRQSMRLLTTKQEVLHESEEIVGEQLDEVNEESDGCLTVSEIAAVYNMTAHDLNSFLVDMKIQRWRCGQYRLLPKYEGLGLTADRLNVSYSLKGKLKYETYLVWTEKGRDFITNLIENGHGWD